MKKTLSLFLALLLCGLLFACGSVPTTLGDEIQLPENGLISAQTLATLKSERKVVTLRDTVDGVPYTWTVFGAEIGEVKDCRFSLRSVKVSAKQVKLRFASRADFGFAPLLTLFLPRSFDADVAAVYRNQVHEESFVCSASVSRSETGSAVSFSVDAPIGDYVIVPQKWDATALTNAIKDALPEKATLEATTLEEAEDTTEGTTAAPTETTSTTAAPTTGAPTAPSWAIPTTKAATTAPAASTTKTQTTTATTAAPPTTTKPRATTTTETQGGTCTFSIECGTVFQHLDALEPGKLDALPSDGVILPAQRVRFSEGENVFDVLQRLCREKGIPMEASFVPLYDSAYVEGIHNLYEFDCGEGSGWMYRVNGVYPNYGCSRYTLQDGDTVEFRYTCDLGADIGGRNEYPK